MSARLNLRGGRSAWDLDSAPEREGWRDRAACAGELPVLFEVAGYGLNEDNQFALTQFCHPCPVRAECGADARRMVDQGMRPDGLFGRALWLNGREYPLVWCTKCRRWVRDTHAAHHDGDRRVVL